MGILALDERTGIVALGIFLAIVVIVVHGAEDVGLAILSSLLVLHGAAAVDSLHGIVGGLEILAVATLVAQRPEDDAGMILLNPDVVLVALHDGLPVAGILSQTAVTVAHAVTLEVCLSHQIDAVLVAEVVPAGIIGVMAGAHSIDVEFLHHLNILNHAAHGNHIASIGVQLVAVCTLEEHRLAVHQHLSTLDLHLAEAYLLGNHLAGAALVGECGIKRIQIGNLCTPLLRVADLHFHHSIAVLVQGRRLGSHLAAISVLQGESHRLAGSIGARELHAKGTVLVIVGQVGSDENVLKMSHRASIHVHLASDACETPEILVLAIASVAPAHHLHGHQSLLAGSQETRHVELHLQFAVLAVANLLAIDPYGQIAGG